MSRITTKLSNQVVRWKFSPGIRVDRSPNLLRLGSVYGGRTFEPSPDLENSVIISCGLGEDASFDIEFASRFNATVIIVDPTPRAVRHFGEIQSHAGEPATQSYTQTGKQPASAYDLSKISPGSLKLEPVALWVEITTLKFYAPPNPEHVSHSIVNYQNSYSSETPSIEVGTATIEQLMAKYGLKSMPLLKLDIEGAEIQVIADMLRRSILPRQILVEFDEMIVPSQRSKERVAATDALLRQQGYLCRHVDGPGKTDHLYVRPS